MPSFVYILECGDKSYYVGSTDNIEKRIQYHNSGNGAVWTAKRLPVKLVYSEIHDDHITASRREKQLKSWTREKKEKLIS